jgi:hypothetical protein
MLDVHRTVRPPQAPPTRRGPGSIHSTGPQSFEKSFAYDSRMADIPRFASSWDFAIVECGDDQSRELWRQLLNDMANLEPIN